MTNAIDLPTVWFLIKNLPLEEKIIAAAKNVYNSQEFIELENELEAGYKALGGTTARDPVTNRVTQVLPVNIGGHPSGTNPGRI